MAKDLLVQLRESAAEQHLWGPGALLLVAVSGGPDSLCLLHLLHRLRPIERLQLHVAHLDHGLRPDSADDGRFVAELAARWDVPVTVERHEVALLALRYGGVEAAARAVRYAMLRETALRLGAAAVVTGHTADDQAETVLLRLLRGAGPTGLAGMRSSLPFDQWRAIGLAVASDHEPTSRLAPSLVRPLLETSRASIMAYCTEHGLEPRLDPTNQSPHYLRNRVRGYIIPQLKLYNPNIVDALGRTARICADEDALLSELLEQAWPKLAQMEGARLVLGQTSLLALHRALRRRALRRAVATIAPGVEVGAAHLDRMLRLIERKSGRLQLPGQLVIEVHRGQIGLEEAAQP